MSRFCGLDRHAGSDSTLLTRLPPWGSHRVNHVYTPASCRSPHQILVRESPYQIPNFGEGSHSPTNFYQIAFGAGISPKLVRGARSKMRGSNAEIVWRRARATRRRSAALVKGLYFRCRIVLSLPCQAGRIQKTSLYAHPGLSYIAAGHRRPRPLKTDASRAMQARQVASWVRLGSQW